jgi:hypothetical protein
MMANPANVAIARIRKGFTVKTRIYLDSAESATSFCEIQAAGNAAFHLADRKPEDIRELGPS